MFNEAMKLKPGRPSKESANNVSTIEGQARNTEHGNSRAYSIDRIQRECDAETVAAVMAGTVTPNAALVSGAEVANLSHPLPAAFGRRRVDDAAAYFVAGCPRCDADLQPAEPVGGWRNWDCPTDGCGFVLPTRDREPATTAAGGGR